MRRLILIVSLLTLAILGTVSAAVAAGEQVDRTTTAIAVESRLGANEAPAAEVRGMAAPTISRGETLLFAVAGLGFLGSVTVLVLDGELRRKGRGRGAKVC